MPSCRLTGFVLLLSGMLADLAACWSGDVLNAVKAWGVLRCGVGEGIAGLFQRDANGRWQGLDVIDACPGGLGAFGRPPWSTSQSNTTLTLPIPDPRSISMTLPPLARGILSASEPRPGGANAGRFGAWPGPRGLPGRARGLRARDGTGASCRAAAVGRRGGGQVRAPSMSSPSSSVAWWRWTRWSYVPGCRASSRSGASPRGRRSRAGEVLFDRAGSV